MRILRPTGVARVNAGLVRLVDPRVGELRAFAATVSLVDGVAPPCGQAQLGADVGARAQEHR